MKCISSPRLAINWNRQASEWFHPKHGIRQGDSISPLIFVLCIERLSHIILNAVNDSSWKGIKLSRNGTHLSHLFFADDIVLFGEATIEQAEVMNKCLRLFCDHSGQKVNTQKSSIFFSKNINLELQQKIVEISGIPKVEDMGKYLGIPSIHGRVKNMPYANLIERI